MFQPVTCFTISTLFCKIMWKANFKTAFLKQIFFLSHSSYQLISYSNNQKKKSPPSLLLLASSNSPLWNRTKELFLILPRIVLLNKRKSRLNWYLNSLWINLFWHLFHQKLKQSFKTTHIFAQKIVFVADFLDCMNHD